MIIPYLELPLCIGYGEGNEEKVVTLKINPNTITAYHEGYYEDVGMFIYIGQQPFQIALTLAQFETRINRYWEIVQNKAKLKIN